MFASSPAKPYRCPSQSESFMFPYSTACTCTQKASQDASPAIAMLMYVCVCACIEVCAQSMGVEFSRSAFRVTPRAIDGLDDGWQWQRLGCKRCKV